MKIKGVELELIIRSWWVCSNCNAHNSKIESCENMKDFETMKETPNLRSCKYCGTVDDVVNETLLKL